MQKRELDIQTDKQKLSNDSNNRSNNDINDNNNKNIIAKQ
jgi:hypothetical protein